MIDNQIDISNELVKSELNYNQLINDEKNVLKSMSDVEELVQNNLKNIVKQTFFIIK